MDKKTLLAVVLSTVIIVGSMVLQPVLFPSKKGPATQTTAQNAPQPTTQQAQQPAPAGQAAPQAAQQSVQAPAVGTGRVVVAPQTEPSASTSRMIQRETDLYALTFSTDGGTLSSVKLKKFKNLDGSLVEMLIQPKEAGTDEIPFALSFGDFKAERIKVPFVLHESAEGSQAIYEFSQTFLSPTGVPFLLRKAYAFYKDEYLFELRVSIENSVNDFPALNFNGYAYTLSMGPQFGPSYTKLDGKNEYRNFVYWADGKRQDPKVQMGKDKELDKRMTWAGVVGKYFTAIAVPDATSYKVAFDSRKITPGFDRSVISFERPLIKSAKNTDTFRFYLGPMKKDILAKYNNGEKNGFNLSGLRMDEAVTSSPLLGWIAQLLKWVMEFFYMLIPNYGVAIILLTIVIKLVFWPLTFKSYESTAKMASINPKMAEIRARFKDKPERMNQEIAALYKKEKINPMSGCLPLLLQMPIFFALYNLLNTHFELRGALFIPGWIPDLSVPESILSFGFTIPLVNWTALRALPLLMVVTQILQAKITQPATADTSQSGAQMKMMNYLMPVVFLFILYDMPSGLVLYWTVQNIVSILQQLYINRVNARKAQKAAIVKTGK